MTEKQPIDCLLITGMHRSGMSVLLECLDLLGVSIGKSKSGKYSGNGAQTTATNEITTTHDVLLRDLGCKWDMVGALPGDWMETRAAKNARERVRNIIKNNFSKNGLWAVADPRLSRLMPLWQSVLQEMNLTPGFLLTIRHPWEVAQSLKKNCRMDIGHGHLLWLALNKEAFDLCQSSPYTVTTYDQLLADPSAILNDIASQFGLSFPNPLQKQIYQILDVVRPEHKHHHLSGFDRSGDDWASFSPFSWLYEQISSHRSALKLLVHETPEDVDADAITREAMPARLYPTPLPIVSQNAAVQKESNQQGNRLFYHFLHLIGQYEREQRDLELKKMHRILRSTRVEETLFARLCIPSEDENANGLKTSAESLLLKNEWQKVRFSIPKPELLQASNLEFAPINTRGVVSISKMTLINVATDAEYWNASTEEGFQSIKLKDAIRLPGNGAFQVMTTGDNAILSLPELPDLPDCPIAFQAWIKVDTSQNIVNTAWQTLLNEKDQLAAKLEGAMADQQAIAARLKEKERELVAVSENNEASRSALKKERDTHKAKSDQLSNELEKVRHDLDARNAENIKIQQTLEEQRKKVQSLQDALSEKNGTNEALSKKVVEMEEAKKAYTQALRERESENDSYWQAQRRHVKEVALLEKKVGELERALGAAKENVGTRFKELSIITHLLKEREDDVNQKEVQLTSLKRQLDQSSDELAAKNRQLNQSSDELAAKDRQLDSSRDQIKHLQQNLAGMSASLKTANEEKKLLHRKLVQRDKSIQAKDIVIDLQRKQMEKIKDSATWKVMAPVRGLSRPFKKSSRRMEPIDEQIEQIRQSDLFDANWYLEQYPDVAEHGLDPAEHYFHFGVSEGRDPGPDFDTIWYMKTYPDVSETGFNPLVHYVKYGKEEGRRPQCGQTL